MPQDRVQRQIGKLVLARIALCAAVVAFGLFASGSAAKAEDDDEESLITKFMHTLGFKSQGSLNDELSYSERSPLVVPPSRALPQPEANAPPTSNWPKDPDMTRRAAAKVKKRVVPHADNVVDSSRPLRPDELNVGRAATPTGGQTAAAGGTAPQAQGTPADVSPKKKTIFSLDWFKKEEYAPFTGEPSRTSLTDPPVGYQTPSPDQPYGISPEKKGYKVPTLGDRVEPVR